MGGGGELEPQVSPKKTMSREVELGCKSWTSSLQVVSQQQCNRHRLCDCPARQLKQQLCGALIAAQWRRDTAVTIVLAAVHGLSSLFWPSLSRSLPTLSPSLIVISNLASVDVKQNGPIVQQAASA